jgi:hypothetical protein
MISRATKPPRKDSSTLTRNSLRIAAFAALIVGTVATTSCGSPSRKPELAPPGKGFSGVADGVSS